jgi:methylated-DNA-protein-cysteine methyltransferase-like protein
MSSISRENFFSNVYEVVKLIPKGRVSTYGAIAKYLGIKSGARMVGWAMNAAHTLSDVPAHRVVNSTGLLTGRHHFNPPELMQQLLESEGISVKNYQVENYKSLHWEPLHELL